jgi:type IV pilus assembly protein PilE
MPYIPLNGLNMSKQNVYHGFTLIELVIVVAIIGILSAIAYPQYTSYVLRANRAEARNALLEAAQWMERNYTLTQSYAVSAQTGNPAITNATLTAIGLDVSPRGGPAKYNISFTANPTANAFVLQAVPAGTQTNDVLCGTLTLNQSQVRGKSGTDTIQNCWGR